MKKKYCFFIIAFLASIGFFAILPSCRPYIDYIKEEPPVDLQCTLNITGGCLDQWTLLDDGTGNKSFEPAGGFLRTLNYLYTLPVAAGGPGPLTSDTTPDSYSGKYAALLTTKNFSPMGSPILIPGLVGTDSLDISAQNIRLGKPYSLKPLRFQGYYKYEPVGGDSAMVSVLLSKYNSVAGKRDTLAIARQIIKNTVQIYTLIDIPLIYDTAYIAQTPDTLTLLLCSSAGINFADLFHCKGQVGSKMWIDEISFIMP